jgi:hypothetical protein
MLIDNFILPELSLPAINTAIIVDPAKEESGRHGSTHEISLTV